MLALPSYAGNLVYWLWPLALNGFYCMVCIELGRAPEFSLDDPKSLCSPVLFTLLHFFFAWSVFLGFSAVGSIIRCSYILHEVRTAKWKFTGISVSILQFLLDPAGICQWFFD